MVNNLTFLKVNNFKHKEILDTLALILSWANYGPWAKVGTFEVLMRPAKHFILIMTSF